MKNTTIKDIMAKHEEHPIAYYPAFERITGSKNVALILSQLSYWFMISGRAFYKKDRELTQETGVTKKEMEKVKKVLKGLEFLRIYTAGNPPVTWYDFDLDRMDESISNSPKGGNRIPQKGEIEFPKRGSLNSPKGGNRIPQKGEHITENTTKTTTKNTTEITFPKTEKNDTTKIKKPKNLQKAPARESGLDCLTDPVFISEMEAWTNGIINASYELDKMRDWLASSGKKYKDYRAFARNWIRRACEAAKKDWDAKQPKQVALNRVEVDEVMEHLRRNEEERRRMGLV